MKNGKYNFGFTLIELTIVCFVLALVSLALIVNFRTGEQSKRVSLARDTVISAVRYAQNQALSGSQIPRSAVYVRGAGGTCTDYSLVSSWVEFVTGNNSAVVMAENRCGQVMRLLQYELPTQVQYQPSAPFALTAAGSSTPYSAGAIRFTPPFAQMTVSTQANPLPSTFSGFDLFTVNLEYMDGGRDTPVVVDGISGKIE